MWVSDEPPETWWGNITGWFGSIIGGIQEATCTSSTVSFDNAWHCNSVDSEYWFDFDNWYDIPPDRYRCSYDEVRGPDEEYEFSHYYAGVGSKVKRGIANVFNRDDGALSGWNRQQITKPDQGPRDHKTITNDGCDGGAPTAEDGEVYQVRDLFSSDRVTGDVYDLS